MIYEYKCEEHGSFDVIKPSAEYNTKEYCPECKKEMVKQICSQSKVKVFKEEFYPAFGKRISSANQLKEEIKKTNAEKGVNLVEVGNEQIKGKVERVKPDMKQAYQDLRKRFQCLS